MEEAEANWFIAGTIAELSDQFIFFNDNTHLSTLLSFHNTIIIKVAQKTEYPLLFSG